MTEQNPIIPPLNPTNPKTAAPSVCTGAAGKSVAAILAKIVRVISIPPVMVLSLIAILCFARDDVLTSVPQIFMAVLCLVVIPVLAYPISMIVPSIRVKGRDGQRNLALVFSGIGYLISFIYAIFGNVTANLRLIFVAYFLSVAILLFCNKILHVRASGHACSVSGPIVFLLYFTGTGGLLPGLALYALIFWASLRLKRHTPSEFLLGTLTCAIAFCVSHSFVF